MTIPLHEIATSARLAPRPRPRWRLRRHDPEIVRALASSQSISNVTAMLLAGRGIRDAVAARAHLEPKLAQLHDPALLPDMAVAARRVMRAIEDEETILVHGDYDVDGVTGTALLVRLLRLFGARVEWHIPDRFTDGYSFGQHSIEKVRACGAKLVISVDNGTSAVETITALRAMGVDTIVTDHHEPPAGELPPAVAIVNPKLASSRYPFRELCGGAVAFKLAWGVCQAASGTERVRPELREFLVEATGDVAIATVCDVVPLVDENRVLARHGLRALETSRRAGVRALLDVCELNGRELLSEDVGFRIGPRINASGRLATAAHAVELLLCDDAARAKELARKLDALNDERKRVESDVLAEAGAQAEAYADRDAHPVLVLAGQRWHQGVVGIVAGRLAARHRRPTIVIGLDGERGRGSARSVPGFSVLEALDGAAAHLVKHGGHAQAAGLEIESRRVDDARRAICERAREMLGPGGFAEPELLVDCDVPFALVRPELQRELDRLQPYGERNERPLFHSADLRLAEPPRACGADRSHLMLHLRSGDHVLKAMAFGMARRESELALGAPIHAVYTPKWNSFRGETRLELELVDFATGPRVEL